MKLGSQTTHACNGNINVLHLQQGFYFLFVHPFLLSQEPKPHSGVREQPG